MGVDPDRRRRLVGSRADWRDALLGPDGLRLEEWRAEGTADDRQDRPAPRRLPGRAARGRRLHQALTSCPIVGRSSANGSAAARGATRASAPRCLAAIGVPTIYADRPGRAAEAQVPLRELPGHARRSPTRSRSTSSSSSGCRSGPSRRRSRVRQRWPTALGVMTARLHDAGIHHIDFHPGNILVRFDPDDEPRAGDDRPRRASVAARLGPGTTAQQNLALLTITSGCAAAGPIAPRSSEPTCAIDRGRSRDARRFARGIEDPTRAWAERLWRRWGRRCRSTNKYFQAIRGRRRLGGGLARARLRRRSAAAGRSRRPVPSPGSTLAQGLADHDRRRDDHAVPGQAAPVIYKRFNRKKWLDPLLNLFRPSRAWRSWQAGQHLASRGIPTPQNLAFLAPAATARRPVLPVPAARDLPGRPSRRSPSSPWRTTSTRSCRRSTRRARRERIRRLTLALARTLRTLHERSLSHRDLKASNILIQDRRDRRRGSAQPDRPGRRPAHAPAAAGGDGSRTWHAWHQPGRRPRPHADRRPAVPPLYLPWGLSPLNDWKPFWRAIERAMRAKRQRNQRRGRPLS